MSFLITTSLLQTPYVSEVQLRFSECWLIVTELILLDPNVSKYLRKLKTTKVWGETRIPTNYSQTDQDIRMKRCEPTT